MFISGCKNSDFLRAHHVPFTHPLCHSLAVLQGADSATSISTRETERLRGHLEPHSKELLGLGPELGSPAAESTLFSSSNAVLLPIRGHG